MKAFLALDVNGNDITQSVVINPPNAFIDTSVRGSFMITYNVVDSNGLSALQVSRNVRISDSKPPVIKIVGTSIRDGETLVSTITADEIVTWELLQGDNMTLQVDGNNVARVHLNEPANYSVKTSHNFLVKATDDIGFFTSRQGIVRVVEPDKDEEPAVNEYLPPLGDYPLIHPPFGIHPMNMNVI